jgi:lysophospholipase L1-like esterase
MIYVFGDSHVGVFVNPIFQRVSSIPATAFNLLKQGSRTDSSTLLMATVKSLQKGDGLIIVVGEIDCRIHIYYQYMKRGQVEPLDLIIHQTIERYGWLLRQLKEAGINVAAYTIPPAGTQDNQFGYSHYASETQRAHIHRRFNEMLRAYCKEFGIGLIDIYDQVCDEKDMISETYVRDGVHLANTVEPLILKEVKRVFEKQIS